MIKEVIIVEGKHDVQAVGRAVDAECIITEGFHLAPRTLERIEQAYTKRGIIILTDPDTAGERIRKFLSKRFPEAKHAFIPKEEATANDDIGIEQASPEAIRSALAKVRYLEWKPAAEFTVADMLRAGLSGAPEAADRRAAAGAELGIGYANAKTFLQRLNHYGVTRNEFGAAVKKAASGKQEAGDD
ncbi:ribonuclease M5|uniref:Ribonuclease M5 n=1 Tax=Dendrosporobacter quercicolus TaxID=146817 RepID=A0A1G9QNL6_9FIRM|nr:ribonuclease M5 [Dendrosporobacter quercicolus]NSL48310.1 ribonuclease M5 [Dendrosporobacter quercicolus DSM 1736]SDM12586.1 ribonuclease M5 [Dendrosporobacter quercicolus]